jgi:serine/threonine protein kinase
MSTKIGRFEILSELAKSDSGCVYKAGDPESGQTLALKTIRMELLGDYAEQITSRILQEAESAKDLSSPHITPIYGAGEIDGQFCAAMEYVQGNSIATMLARKEGFSIWDLLDISRQVCAGLDHAHQHKVFHFNLEPAKIMVTWDGTVKILSFGISSIGYMVAGSAGAPPSALFYMSPEQICGEPLNARSNLFSWGAMLYQMVTNQKAFDGADADAVRHSILNEMPAPPSRLNPRINPVASEVIMKALAKDPAERYQSGCEMANDLERCREAVSRTKKPEPPRRVAPDKIKAATSAKLAGPATSRPAPAKFEAQPGASSQAPSSMVRSGHFRPAEDNGEPAAPPEASAQKAAAVAAGWNSGTTSSSRTPQLDESTQSVSAGGGALVEGLENQSPYMSSASIDEASVEKHRIAVDPLMAEGGGLGSTGVRFSDLEELPPLQEVYIAPPAPKPEDPVEEAPLPSIIARRTEPEKPKVQPREVAEKAMREIKSVPPQLLMYSVSAAIVLILFIGIAVFWHAHTQNTDEDGGAVPTASAPPQSAPTQAHVPELADTAPQSTLPAEAPAEPPVAEPPVEERETARSTSLPTAKPHNGKRNRNSRPSAPAMIPGQLMVDSTPQGAQIQVDGHGDPAWVTPCTVTTLAPGQHTVVISKVGFGQAMRTADVSSANRTSLVVHLTPLTSTVVVGSDPPGASIYLDGKDTLRMTPSQVTLEKGSHTILVRKPGFLDETTSATAQPGQTSRFSPTLRPLGNADDIKSVGKFKKLFGRGYAQTGMGKLSIRTTPKGAQIAVNRRMLEKVSPTEFLVNPGNYIVDITLTGYKPVQKVITVDQGGNVAIDETLQAD